MNCFLINCCKCHQKVIGSVWYWNIEVVLFISSMFEKYGRLSSSFVHLFIFFFNCPHGDATASVLFN